MLEMKGYHENIVNLQGITYKKGHHGESSIEVRFSTVLFKNITFQFYQKLSFINSFFAQLSILVFSYT